MYVMNDKIHQNTKYVKVQNYKKQQLWCIQNEGKQKTEKINNPPPKKKTKKKKAHYLFTCLVLIFLKLGFIVI